MKKRMKVMGLLLVVGILLAGAFAYGGVTSTGGAVQDYQNNTLIKGWMKVIHDAYFTDDVDILDTLCVKTIVDTNLTVTNNATVGNLLAVTDSITAPTGAFTTFTATTSTTDSLSVTGNTSIAGELTADSTITSDSIHTTDFSATRGTVTTLTSTTGTVTDLTSDSARVMQLSIGARDTLASAATVTLSHSFSIITGTTDIDSFDTDSTIPDGGLSYWYFTGTKGSTGVIDGKNLLMPASFGYTPDDVLIWMRVGDNLVLLGSSAN